MWIRILKYAIKNILRNKFLSISSILVLTLLMFFINVLFVMHDSSLKMIDSINSRLTISLYLGKDNEQIDYDNNSQDVKILIDNILNIDDNIKAQYKTKTQVLKDLRERDPKLVSILEDTNPLPNTYVISGIGLEYYDKLNLAIENKSFVLENSQDKKDIFSNYNNQYNNILNITNLLNKAMIGLYIIISIFAVSIGIIIYSIIGNFIYYYRDEIYITRLVGGSKKFIFGPFSLQGAIYSIIGFFLSFLIFYISIQNIDKIFGETYKYDFKPDLFLMELLVFTLIGAISGLLSSKKYINRTS